MGIRLNKQAAGAKPFVKWVGGKRQLQTKIDTLLPEGFLQSGDWTYIEPFVGGGAMLFHILQENPHIKHAVINDVNPHLIAAYRTVKDQPEALILLLKDIETAYLALSEEERRKEFYLHIRSEFNERSLNDMTRTAYFIFLNRTCFNGLYRENSKGLFNVPFGRYANPRICDEETILADAKLLQRVTILCGDFEGVKPYVDANTFVYFDPPYRPLSATSSFTSYNKDDFDDNDQKRLKRFFDTLSANGCLLMLSNSDGRAKNPADTFFDDLYKDYYIERVYASRSINANPLKRGTLTELLIRNYSGDNQIINTKRPRYASA